MDGQVGSRKGEVRQAFGLRGETTGWQPVSLLLRHHQLPARLAALVAEAAQPGGDDFVAQAQGPGGADGGEDGLGGAELIRQVGV